MYGFQDIHEEKERESQREQASTKPAWATKQNPALSPRLESGWLFQDHPKLHSQFWASMGYIRSHTKHTHKRKEEKNWRKEGKWIDTCIKSTKILSSRPTWVVWHCASKVGKGHNKDGSANKSTVTKTKQPALDLHILKCKETINFQKIFTFHQWSCTSMLTSLPPFLFPHSLTPTFLKEH